MKKLASRTYRNLYATLAFVPLLFLLAFLISARFVSHDEDGMYLVTKMHGKEMPFKMRLSDVGQAPSPLFFSSPNNDQLLVVLWENAGYSFYLTDPQGSFMKRISRQSTGEGSGGVLTDTIAWTSAGDSVEYIESAVVCNEDACEAPDDFQQALYVTSVNIKTLEETRTEIREDELL